MDFIGIIAVAILIYGVFIYLPNKFFKGRWWLV